MNTTQELRIVLLGPPGAGKGTQAVLLARDNNISHIATGDIMRKTVAEGSPLGKKISAILDKGELVPDALVMDMMKARLSEADCRNGFVLDGFPRTVEQAKGLRVLLEELNISLSHVLELIVLEDVIINRIKKRGELGSGRSDDTAEIAAKRLQVYWAQTAPIIQFYESDGAKVLKVDGLGSVEEVQATIRKAIRES